jgi:DNA-binding NtrC family response regulator
MTGFKVLLVDDEEDFVTTLAERLASRGYAVEVALDGESALELVENRQFDAIFLDLAMPGLDGIETLKRLKARKRDLQVVLLTGRATVEQGVEAMKLGALDLVEKPADIKEIVAKVEEASARRAVLAEQRVMDELSKIVRERGW